MSGGLHPGPRPPSPRTGRAQHGDVSLYYEEHGEGHPVVLIHGWTLNCRMWDDQVDALSAKYRVICYDRRGFGQSTGHPETAMDAHDLAELLDRLDIPRASVLGMSQGGCAALYFALDHPDRTAALVLNATILPGFNLPFSGPDRVPADQYAEAARSRGMDAMRDLWVGHPFYAVARTRPHVLARLREIVAAYSGADLTQVKVPAVGGGADAVARMSELDLPTLILIGEHDVPYIQVVAHALAYGIRNATTVTLPGCDHLANMEAPEAFNDALIRFLDTVDWNRAGRIPSGAAQP